MLLDKHLETSDKKVVPEPDFPLKDLDVLIQLNILRNKSDPTDFCYLRTFFQV